MAASGELLCRLIHAIVRDDVRDVYAPSYDLNVEPGDGRALSNIRNALASMAKLGLRKDQLFSPEDLDTNFHRVIQCLLVLGTLPVINPRRSHILYRRELADQAGVFAPVSPEEVQKVLKTLAGLGVHRACERQEKTYSFNGVGPVIVRRFQSFIVGFFGGRWECLECILVQPEVSLPPSMSSVTDTRKFAATRDRPTASHSVRTTTIARSSTGGNEVSSTATTNGHVDDSWAMLATDPILMSHARQIVTQLESSRHDLQIVVSVQRAEIDDLKRQAIRRDRDFHLHEIEQQRMIIDLRRQNDSLHVAAGEAHTKIINLERRLAQMSTMSNESYSTTETRTESRGFAEQIQQLKARHAQEIAGYEKTIQMLRTDLASTGPQYSSNSTARELRRHLEEKYQLPDVRPIASHKDCEVTEARLRQSLRELHAEFEKSSSDHSRRMMELRETHERTLRDLRNERSNEGLEIESKYARDLSTLSRKLQEVQAERDQLQMSISSHQSTVSTVKTATKELEGMWEARINELRGRYEADLSSRTSLLSSHQQRLVESESKLQEKVGEMRVLQLEHAHLKTQIEDLQAKIEVLTSQNKMLTTSLETAKRELLEARNGNESVIVSLRSELKVLTERMRVLSQERDALAATVSQFTAARQQLISEHSAALAELQRALAAKDEQLARSEASHSERCRQLQAETDAKVNEIATIRKQYEQQLRDLTSRHDVLLNERDLSYNAKLRELQQSLREGEETQSSLRKQVDSLNLRITQLESDLVIANTKLSQEAANREILKKEYSANVLELQTAMAQREKQHEAAQAQWDQSIQQARERIIELEQLLAAAEQARRSEDLSSEDRFRKLQQDHERATSELVNEHRRVVADLQSQLAAANSEITALNFKIDMLSTLVETSKREYAAGLKSLEESMAEKVRSHAQEKEELEHDIRNLRARISELETSLGESQAALRDAEARWRGMVEEGKMSAQAGVDALRRENESLKRSLSELELSWQQKLRDQQASLIQAKEIEISQLRAQFDSEQSNLQVTIQTLQREITTLKSKLTSQEELTESNKAHHATVIKQLNSFIAEKDALLQQQKAASDHELEASRARLLQLENELNSFRAVTKKNEAQYQSEIARLTAERDKIMHDKDSTMSSRLSELQLQLDASRRELTDTVASKDLLAQQTFANFEKERQTLRSRISELEAQDARNHSMFDEYTKQISALTMQIDEHRSQLSSVHDTATSRAVQLDQSLESVRSECRTLESQKAAMATEIDGLKQQIASLTHTHEARVTELETTISSVKSAYETAVHSHSRIVDELNAHHKQESQVQNTRIAELQAELARTLKESSSTVSADRQKMQEQITQLEASVLAANEKHREILQTNLEQAARIVQLESDATAHAAVIEQMKSDQEKSITELEEMLMADAEAQRELAVQEWKARVDELEEELTILRTTTTVSSSSMSEEDWARTLDELRKRHEAESTMMMEEMQKQTDARVKSLQERSERELKDLRERFASTEVQYQREIDMLKEKINQLNVGRTTVVTRERTHDGTVTESTRSASSSHTLTASHEA